MELKANILRIERLSLSDGKGMRTVVFFKGCPLRCAWCSTPESQSGQWEVYYMKERCTGCGACVALCPLNNIELESGKPKWGNNCTHCMACICRCPNKAIEYGKSSFGKPRYNCPNI